MNDVPWGWLTALDAVDCDHDAINCKETITAFVEEVLERIEMVPIGPLHIQWCVTNDPMKVGLSFYQILQDSNISGHFCPANKNAGFVDIFSCKEYSAYTVQSIFEKHFCPRLINMNFIERWIPQ